MASSNFGVPITPAALKDGSLRASFDSVAYPQSTGFGAVNVAGTPKVGALGRPVLAAPVLVATGGAMAAGSYSYQVAAVGMGGLGVPSTAQSTVTTGATSTVTLTWSTTGGETNGYKIYRNGLHLADVGHSVLTYIDSGSVAPSGAIPTQFPGARGSAENSAAARLVDSGPDAYEGEGDTATPTAAGAGARG